MTQTLDYEPNMVLATQTFNVVGTRPVRHDGADKVTGRALYGADFDTAGLLHGKILRSPHAHARIKSIDTSAAEALPGVAAIVTNADFASDSDAMVDLGEGATSLKWLRDNVLASDKALYKGHAIAGVAASNPHVAEEAVELIEVDYEILPPVVTVGGRDGRRRADSARRPQDRRAWRADRSGQQRRPALPAQEGRHRRRLRRGGRCRRARVPRQDRPPGLHRATQRHRAVERRRQGPRMVQHTGRVRRPRRDGSASGNARIQIRVTPMEIGGGFGGKIPIYLEPVAALLSRKSGRSREDT